MLFTVSMEASASIQADDSSGEGASVDVGEVEAAEGDAGGSRVEHQRKVVALAEEEDEPCEVEKGEGSVGEEEQAEEALPVGKTSTLFASYNIVCCVVGSGLLGLPYGLAESGWVGVGLLIAIAVVGVYTASVLVQCLSPPSGRKLVRYGDIGREALGKPGEIAVTLVLHIALLGIATLFLILAGGNLSSLLAAVPWPTAEDYEVEVLVISDQLAIVIVAGAMWGHVWLKTMHEVGFTSAVNMLVALFLFVVVILEILVNVPSPRGDHTFINLADSGLSLAGGFVTFSFSFGANAVIPSVYETMAKPQQFRPMIAVTYTGILGLYLPMAVLGYWAYGDGALSPIYRNICTDGDDCTYWQLLGIWLAVMALTVHVILAYAVILHPTERLLEQLLGVDKLHQPKSKIASVCLRTAIMAATVVVACLVPDFTDFMNLVSSLSRLFGAIFAIVSLSCDLFDYTLIESLPCESS